MITARTPSPGQNVPISPGDIRKTSDLSPSKFNEMFNEHPLQTSPSPSPKRNHRGRPLPRLSGHSPLNNDRPILTENIRPNFRAKYPSLPQLDDDSIPTFSPRSAKVQHTKSYQQMLDYTATAIDPFHDTPNVLSNVGRRRANAISLADSPARRGHSQEMARIYQKAQETVQYQDEVAKRLAVRERPVLSTSTPIKRNYAATDLRHDIKETSKDTIIHRKSVTKSVFQPILPEWQPLSRLSDDLPDELRIKSSIPRPLRVRHTPSTKQLVPAPLKLSKSPSSVIRSPRRRPGNASVDSGIGVVPALKRQDAFCDPDNTENNLESFGPMKHVATAMPRAETFATPNDKRVATWLEDMDSSPLPVKPMMTPIVDSPVEAFHQLQAQSSENLDAGIQTPSSSSRTPSAEATRKHSSTISKLVCIPPLRLRFPSSASSSKIALPSLATPPRRFKIPARNGSQPDGLASRTRQVSNSSRSRSFFTAVPDVADTPVVRKPSVELDTVELAPLSPSVALYRKGKDPKAKIERRPSYWDEDILTPKQNEQKETDGAIDFEDGEVVSPLGAKAGGRRHHSCQACVKHD